MHCQHSKQLDVYLNIALNNPYMYSNCCKVVTCYFSLRKTSIVWEFIFFWISFYISIYRVSIFPLLAKIYSTYPFYTLNKTSVSVLYHSGSGEKLKCFPQREPILTNPHHMYRNWIMKEWTKCQLTLLPVKIILIIYQAWIGTGSKIILYVNPCWNARLLMQVTVVVYPPTMKKIFGRKFPFCRVLAIPLRLGSKVWKITKSGCCMIHRNQ